MDKRTKRNLAIGVWAAVSVAAVAYYVVSTADQPLYKRIVPWVLVYEHFTRGGPLTTFGKFQVMSLVSLMAVAIMLLRRTMPATYHAAELLFGIATAWYSMSFDMTASP